MLTHKIAKTINNADLLSRVVSLIHIKIFDMLDAFVVITVSFCVLSCLASETASPGVKSGHVRFM